MNPFSKPPHTMLAMGLAFVAVSAVAQSLTPLVPVDGTAASPWRFVGFPKSKADIPPTRFELAEVQGERALKVSTRASYGTWVHDLPNANPGRLQWRWRLDQPLTGGKGALLGQWQTESRDVAADFSSLFADEIPTGAAVPQVRAVLIGADSDNTGAESVAWLKSLTWTH